MDHQWFWVDLMSIQQFYSGIASGASSSFPAFTPGTVQSVREDDNPGNTTALCYINTDGSFSHYAQHTDFTSTGFDNYSWYSPEAEGVGTGKYVKISANSGSAPNAGNLVLNTWTEITSQKSFGRVGISGFGTATVSFSDDGGATVASTGTIGYYVFNGY